MNYQDILRYYNFTSSDYLPNTYIVPDGNGVYSISYTFLNPTNLLTTDSGINTNYYLSVPEAQVSSLPSEVSPELQTAIKTILKHSSITVDQYSVYFGDVANITFDKLDTGGDIAIGNGNNDFFTEGQHVSFGVPASALSYPINNVPQIEALYGDVWINSDRTDRNWDDASKGSVAFYILLHEIGHSLGLVHPTTLNDPLYTVMSYNPYAGMGEELYVSGLQMADIVALQSIYGRNYATRGTDDANTASVNEANTLYKEGQGFGATATDPFVYTIWDGAGVDVVDASSYSHAVLVDLRQGKFSSIGASADENFAPLGNAERQDAGLARDNLGIAHYAIIENAIGTNDTGHKDILIGNAWNNVLYGGDGTDKIYGDGVSYDTDVGFRDNDANRPGDDAAADGSGDDVLIGGNGDDTLYGGKGNDILHGGLIKSEITALRTDWDAAGHFSALTNIQHVNDGKDTADYSTLSGGGVSVVYDSDGGTVTKGASGAFGTDHLISIETVKGAELASNTFKGSNGDIVNYTELTYVGGGKSDQYIFDLSEDLGAVRIVDGGTSGIDQITITNVTTAVATTGVNTTTINGADYLVLDFQPELGGLLALYVAWDSVENISIDGQWYRMNDIQAKIDQYPSMSLNGYTTTEFYNAIYPTQGGSGGSGTGGGVTPTVDPVSGEFTAMSVNPSVSNYFLDYRYADETLHPWVITSYSSSAGHMSVSFDSYLKNIQMVGGISWDDIRFTASSAPGDASLTIWIDSLNSSYTISHFEAGKIIHGMGIYGAGMHSYIQNSPNITLNGGAPGQYSGYYLRPEDEDEEDRYEYVGSPMTAHYFLETFSVSGIPTINMQTDVLTFKGTAASEALYGLDTRDDIIMGFDGNDTMHGYGGNDTLIGGGGRDALHGGAGNDVYVFGQDFSSGSGIGYDAIGETNGSGTDTIRFTEGIEASDVYMWTDMYGYIWFEVGDDPENNTLMVLGTITGTGVVTYVERVEFDDQTVLDFSEGIHIRNNDTGRNLFGTIYGDVIEGGAGSDTLNGYGDDDTLIGGGGRDILYGGAGDDVYVFGQDFSSGSGYGYDTISEAADAGTDTIRFTDGVEADDVYLWTDMYGYLWLQAGDDANNNTLTIPGAIVSGVGVTTNVERVEFDDQTVWDISEGFHIRNNDTGRSLFGTTYDDVIEGGAGSDTLYGYGGDDTLIGRAGNDQIFGGAGADTFVFLAADVGNGIDHIVDFTLAQGDRLDLRDVLSGYDPLADALSDFVQFTTSPWGETIVKVDTDGIGTGQAWTQIATLQGVVLTDPDVLVTNGHLLAA